MLHAAEVAQFFDAPYVRIFSFFLRAGSDPDDYRDEVLRRMRALADVAEEAGVILLHENEKDIYGDIPRRCHDIVTSVDSPNLKLAWDPANFVQVGVQPFTEGYSMLRPYVEYVQVKDALLADASVVVAGAGDGQVVETVRALRDDGFDGFFSLEPHLGKYTEFGALSGPELFTSAWRAFTGILEQEDGVLAGKPVMKGFYDWIGVSNEYVCAASTPASFGRLRNSRLTSARSLKSGSRILTTKTSSPRSRKVETKTLLMLIRLRRAEFGPGRRVRNEAWWTSLVGLIGRLRPQSNWRTYPRTKVFARDSSLSANLSSGIAQYW